MKRKSQSKKPKQSNAFHRKVFSLPSGNHKKFIPIDKRQEITDRQNKYSKGFSKASRDGFYGSVKWQNLRFNYINENPLCEECDVWDRIVAGDVVDHKKPIHTHPELRLDWDNLQTLCDKPPYNCHQRKTQADNRGDKGLRGKDLFNFLKL